MRLACPPHLTCALTALYFTDHGPLLASSVVSVLTWVGTEHALRFTIIFVDVRIEIK